MAPHWTCRLALALLLLSGLTGCSEDDSFEGCAGPIPIRPGLPNPGIVRTNGPARVYALPISFSMCEGDSSTYPSSATAEVTGPAGELLPARIELGTRATVTAVQFTPEQPGPHHILLEFAPRGGIHQVDVHAALDRSAEAPIQSLSQSCASLERTAQGAWVCDSAVVRGTESLGSFPNSRLAVAGDVVWVVDGLNVRRYVDTGTALTQTGTAGRGLGGVEFLLASPNELVVLFNGSLALYTFQGGVLTPGGVTPWTRPNVSIMPESPYGVLLREGNQLAIATRVRADPVFEVCPYLLLSGKFERTPGDCARFPGEIIGFEPGILWTRDQPATSSTGERNPVQLRRWVWAGGQLAEQSSISLGLHVLVADRPKLRTAVVPLVRNTPPPGNTSPVAPPDIPLVYSVVMWSPQRKALILDHLDHEMTNGLASPGLYWALAPAPASQATKVRIRPPAP